MSTPEQDVESMSLINAYMKFGGGSEVFIRERDRRWDLMRTAQKELFCTLAGVPEAAEKKISEMTRLERIALKMRHTKLKNLVAQISKALY